MAHGAALQLGSAWEAEASRTCLLPVRLAVSVGLAGREVGGGLTLQSELSGGIRHRAYPCAEVFISLLESNLGIVTLCVQGLSSSTPSAVPLFVREGLLFN